MAWGNVQKASRFVKDFDPDDVYDQIDAMREQLKSLSSGFGKAANQQIGRARDFASDAVQDAEETMKDNLAASLLIALGLGVVVGFLLGRGSE